MSLWDSVAERFRAEAVKYKAPWLAPHAPLIEEGAAYCRVWLVEMRLARGTDWFNTRYPVVYAATRYEYNGKIETIPYIAGAGTLKWMTERGLEKVITGNFALTPQFPYQRGLVEFQAGLFSMRSDNVIGSFIETMQSFARLLPVAELSSVLNVVSPLHQGIEKLFNQGDSRFELGYFQTFTSTPGGENRWRQGHFAVILVEEREWDDSRLSVVGDSLYLQPEEVGAKAAPLTGYNYMLFRVDSRSEQDWEALGEINELVSQAQDAILSKQRSVARDLLTTIKVAIARSPDVVRADRKPMYLKIEQELRDLGLQARAPKRSLYQIMQASTPPTSPEFDADWARLVGVFGNSRRGVE
jgi:hypothetical protein